MAGAWQLRNSLQGKKNPKKQHLLPKIPPLPEGTTSRKGEQTLPCRHQSKGWSPRQSQESFVNHHNTLLGLSKSPRMSKRTEERGKKRRAWQRSTHGVTGHPGPAESIPWGHRDVISQKSSTDVYPTAPSQTKMFEEQNPRVFWLQEMLPPSPHLGVKGIKLQAL